MKNLIMVDIQREYAKNYKGSYSIDGQYVRNILSYIRKMKFDNIFCVVDCNSGHINIPYRLQNKIDGFFFKNYAGYCMDEVQRLIEEGEMTIIEENVAYKNCYGQLVLVTDNCHETQTVNEDLEKLISLIRENENYLIGGCDGECLQDIEKVLDYHNINYTREDSLIYPIYTPVVKDFDTIDWVEIECPY